MSSISLFGRWATVGTVNSVLGILLIWTLRGAGLGEYISNVLGYAILIPFSFLIHSRFSLRVPLSTKNFALYLIAFGLAYLANLTTLYLFVEFAGLGMLAQLFGMVAYVGCSLVLTHFWLRAPGSGVVKLHMQLTRRSKQR
jgi:putative flippase GtrA